MIIAADSAPQFAVGGLLIILFMLVTVALSVGLLIFWIWTLVDCIKNTPSEDNLKLVWILVIVLAGWIGSIIYLVAQRPKNQALE